MTQFFDNISNVAKKMHSTPVPGCKMKSLGIIALCKLLIVRKIAEKVRENELYSIICDKCTGVSNKGELSLSVKFVADEQIHEGFLVVFFFSLTRALQEEHLLPSWKGH